MFATRRMRLARTAISVCALLTVPHAALHAQAADWPSRLRQDMVRVATIEWRLRTAAANSCPVSGADIGVLLDDRRAYARKDWPLLESTVGLGEDPEVIGVIPQGPAERAGLREGDAILSIGGKAVQSIATERNAGALVAEALVDEIAAGDPGKDLVISARRDGSVRQFRVTPVRHCAARLVLSSDKSVDAHSDARNVAISTGLVAFARNDDEIALAAGHELAHIILRHRKGGGISARRAMEDDADSLGLRLMNCAGYQGSKGFGLFQRLGANDWLGFLRAPTHRSFAKRVERLKKELPGLTCPAVGVKPQG